MEWKSLFIGLLIGALIAVPLGMAHSGGFDIAERAGPRWGFGPMGGYGMHGGMMGMGPRGMMGYGMMDDEMYAQMQDYMASGNFTEIHEEMESQMEPYMEQHMGGNWAEMHKTCERYMGIEDTD